MPALQTTFDRTLADPKHRPVIGMEGAKSLLDLNEDYILSLIEDGALAFAWNIAVGKIVREIRILRASIDHYIAYGSKRQSLAEADAFKSLLPPGHTAPVLTNPEIQRSLNCGADHVIALRMAGELAQQPGTVCKRGQNGSLVITLESFERFITTRRMKREETRRN